jgi:aryl-alcohol dehydrogenase-like predicted oxidoreductase
VLLIPGAKNARQAKDNAQAIDFEINDREATRLDEASWRWR